MLFLQIILFSGALQLYGEEVKQKGNCLFPTLKEGEPWDTFWAQHYVGADLMREELQRLKGVEDIHPEDIIGIWDDTETEHGEYVGQIIAGPKSSAVIPFDGHLSHQNFRVNKNYLKKYELFYQECRNKNNCPLYINNSMHWNGLDLIVDLVSRMSTTGTTLIVSAGNSSRKMEQGKAKVAKKGYAITVASLNSKGYPSHFTSYDNHITIAAPSDNSIRSYNFQGEKKDFGGTSGAASLVTGSLGGFTLLSGYPLETRQAKELLTKTAIALPSLPKNHQLGAGMLNSYKIGRVALRLKETCGLFTERPSDYSCLSNLLADEETYHFKEESIRLFNNSIQSFPQCLVKPQAFQHVSCENCIKDFNNIRKAAFLDSENSKIWGFLSCIKRNYFKSGKSSFYHSLSNRFSREAPSSFNDICKKNPKLIKYLHGEFFLSFTKMGCHKRIIHFLSRSLENAVHTVDFGKLLQFITYYPQSDGHSLSEVASMIKNSFDMIVDAEVLLATLIEQSQATGRSLKYTFDAIDYNFDKIIDSRDLLQKMIEAPAINNYTLGRIASMLRRNLDHLSHPQSLLKAVIDHPKSESYSLGQSAHVIEKHFSKLPEAQRFLEAIIRHTKISGHSLGKVAFAIGNNIEKISGSHYLFKTIIEHPKSTSDSLVTTALVIGSHADKIPHSYHLLRSIIDHSKIGHGHLQEVAYAISSDIKKNPDFEKLLNYMSHLN